MNKNLLSRVFSVAQQVRIWTHERAVRAKYNSHNLSGWCAISSAHLFRELRKAKITAELHYVSGHCFVVVEDHVVDVTATQFGEFTKTPILILHLKEAEQHWFYKTEKIFENPTELREHQLKEKWPRCQIAYTR